MYYLRCTVTGEQVTPWFWTKEDAEAALGHSELLRVEFDRHFPVPRDLDTSIGARERRRGKACDPYGEFWEEFWRKAKERRQEADE